MVKLDLRLFSSSKCAAPPQSIIESSRAKKSDRNVFQCKLLLANGAVGTPILGRILLMQRITRARRRLQAWPGFYLVPWKRFLPGTGTARTRFACRPQNAGTGRPRPWRRMHITVGSAARTRRLRLRLGIPENLGEPLRWIALSQRLRLGCSLLRRQRERIFCTGNRNRGDSLDSAEDQLFGLSPRRLEHENDYYSTIPW